MKSEVRNQSETRPIGLALRVQSSPGGLEAPDDRTRTRQPAPDPVTLDRDHLAHLVALARRAVRDDQDLDSVHRAQLIARSEGGPR